MTMEDLLSGLMSLDFTLMLVRFVICLLVNWLIVDKLYYKKSKRRDFYFTLIIIGVAIFFIVFFMIFVLEDMKGKTGIGVGIGMFGIFSIMRYRTDAMPVREMTYLFVVLCLSVVNALASTMPLVELLITNLIIIIVVWFFEHLLKVVPCKLIQYDRLDLVKPDRREELIEDIRERTGLDVITVEVGGIDMLRDMAVVKVYYKSQNRDVSNSVNNKVKVKDTEYTEFNS